jgi:two-component system nitrogen regulation response regulator GlnG
MSSLQFQGNVRQLENLANWLTVMAPAQTIEIKDLPPDLVPAHVAATEGMHALAGDGATAGAVAANGVLAGAAGGLSTGAANGMGNMPGATGAIGGALPGGFGSVNGVAPSPVSIWESGLRTEVARLLRENSADVMDELSRRFEAAVIREALDFTRGRKVEAAERLGIGRNTITRKIQELNLE